MIPVLAIIFQFIVTGQLLYFPLLAYSQNLTPKQRENHYLTIKKTTCPYLKLPKTPSDITIVPKILFQTHYNKSEIPNRITQATQSMAKGYDTYLLDDDDIRCFLMQYFPEHLDLFERMQGAHKADIARYLLLYQFGGVYLDIKTIPLKPLDTIFPTHTLSTSLSALYPNDKRIFQAIMASPARNPFLLTLIDHAPKTGNVPHYTFYLEDFAEQIKSYTTKPLKPGTLSSTQKSVPNFYLLREGCVTQVKHRPELCSRLDRYGLCCHVYDQHNQPVFIARDPEYPWNGSQYQTTTQIMPDGSTQIAIKPKSKTALFLDNLWQYLSWS